MAKKKKKRSRAIKSITLQQLKAMGINEAMPASGRFKLRGHPGIFRLVKD